MMASKRQQPHHYYSVFIDFSDKPTQMQHFGYSERIAAWQFYKTIKAAERKPGATAVDLRQDGNNVASVNIKQAAIA